MTSPTSSDSDRARARQRAERCFALATSTPFDGERNSAIARGMAIVELAGLDPESFDIPGRQRLSSSSAARSQKCDPRTGRPETIYTSEAGDGFDYAAWQAKLDAAIAQARRS